MQFQDDVVGGVTLIRPAIQSPNYVAGTSGWTINADGTAEFSDLTIRSSDGSSSTVTIANGEIEIVNGAAVVVSTISADGYKLFHPTTGDLLAESTLDGGSDSLPGFIAYSQLVPESYVYMGDDNIEFGRTDTALALNPSLSSSGLGSGNDNNVSTFLTGGKINGNSTAPHFRLDTSANGSGNAAFVMDALGGTAEADLELTGQITNYNGNAFDTYVPVVAGDGTATFTSVTGWYQRVGKMVLVNIEFVVNAAGSGATIVTVTLPSTPYRASNRQTLSAHSKGVWTAGMAANGCGVIMDTGAGDVIDQISTSNDNALNRDGVITGANLLAGSRVSIQGWYREA